MANEAEKAIAVRLANAPTFHPVTADLFVNDWGLDAGDVVTVRSGETDYSVPIYNMSLDWRGSAMAQIQSTGNKERKPLSALKRKQYYGRSSSRRYTEEQGTIIETRFIQDETKIGMVVTERDGQNIVNAASIVAGINSQDKTSSSYVDISADYINLTGYVTATALDARLINVDALFAQTGYAGTIYATNVSATGTVSGVTGDYTTIYGANYWVVDGQGDPDFKLGNSVTAFGTSTASGGTITIPYYTSAHPWGSQTPAGNITFNIADTAYYQNHVGISSTGSWTWNSSDEVYYRTITARDGSDADIGLPTITTSVGNWVNNTCIVTVKGPGDHAITTATVTGQGSGSYADGWNDLVEAADTSSYVQYSGYNSVSSSLTKSNGTIDGYIWLKDYSGTWQRRRHLTVSYPNDSYNKSVTLTYQGSVNGVYTYTTSTYVSGLTTGSRYTVHFNA